MARQTSPPRFRPWAQTRRRRRQAFLLRPEAPAATFLAARKLFAQARSQRWDSARPAAPARSSLRSRLTFEQVLLRPRGFQKPSPASQKHQEPLLIVPKRLPTVRRGRPLLVRLSLRQASLPTPAPARPQQVPRPVSRRPPPRWLARRKDRSFDLSFHRARTFYRSDPKCRPGSLLRHSTPLLLARRLQTRLSASRSPPQRSMAKPVVQVAGYRQVLVQLARRCLGPISAHLNPTKTNFRCATPLHQRPSHPADLPGLMVPQRPPRHFFPTAPSKLQEFSPTWRRKRHAVPARIAPRRRRSASSKSLSKARSLPELRPASPETPASRRSSRSRQ